MFNIKFVDSGNIYPTGLPHMQVDPDQVSPSYRRFTDDGVEYFDAYGEITIGDFTEGFAADLFFWSKEDYVKQWNAALQRLVLGATNKTAFITRMDDPSMANFIEWWPATRIGKSVYFTNHLLFLDSLDKPFDVNNIDQSVVARSMESGKKIKVEDLPDSVKNNINDFSKYLESHNSENVIWEKICTLDELRESPLLKILP